MPLKFGKSYTFKFKLSVDRFDKIFICVRDGLFLLIFLALVLHLVD